MRSFKVIVFVGEPSGAENAMRFAVLRDAERYASDLAARWTAVERYVIEESDDAPNT